MLLFGDDYQVLLVAGSGAINGYVDINGKHVRHTATKKSGRFILPLLKMVYIPILCRSLIVTSLIVTSF